jgi:PhnB protein
MPTELKAMRQGASTVIPRLFCRDVANEIEFCKATFDALEVVVRPAPDGKPAHAMMGFGGAMLMIESEWPGLPSRAPQANGESPVVVYVYVENVEEAIRQAVAAGATVLRAVDKQLWGDRIGWLLDPQGHVWTVATHVEDVVETEIRARWSEMLREPTSKGD